MKWLQKFGLWSRKNAPVSQSADSNALCAFLTQYDDCANLVSLERDIKQRFSLYRRTDPDQPNSLPARTREEIAAAQNNQLVASAYIFHGDGRVREAALNALNGPIDFSATVYGVLRRLNDWSGNVRSAAERALKRCVMCTPIDVVAPSAWIILQQASSWQRWNEDHPQPDFLQSRDGAEESYAALVMSLSENSSLMDKFVRRLCDSGERGATAVFQALSRSPSLDPHLPHIASYAQQPHLRALAIGYLTSGHAIWPLSTKRKVWTNKALGEYRSETNYKQRKLSLPTESFVTSVLTNAFGDPAPLVRRKALDALTSLRDDERLAPLIEEALSRFESDPWPSIRSRRDYLAKVRVMPLQE